MKACKGTPRSHLIVVFACAGNLPIVITKGIGFSWFFGLRRKRCVHRGDAGYAMSGTPGGA